jgi:hypothetical protein
MRSDSRVTRGMRGRGLIVALLASAALPCAAAEAAECHVNSAFGGVRSFLPDCREYEMVTPPYKDGSPPEELSNGQLAVSRDGDHVFAFDTGGLAGTENDEINGKQKGGAYEISRGANGWSAEPISPSAEAASRSLFVTGSADLTRSLWEMAIQAEPGEEVPFGSGLFSLAVRERVSGGETRITPVGPEDAPGAPARTFSFEGASSDLSTILFSSIGRKAHFPGDKTRGPSSLYAYTGTHNREPVLVGVKNDGPIVGATVRNEHAELVSECGAELGSGSAGGSTYNGVSSDGSTIFFTALRGLCEAPAVNELYARIDADKTVAISEPAMTAQREEECTGVCREDELSENGRLPSPANFRGASKNGHKVFFTTEQPMLDLDRDTGNDVYEAEVEGGTLTRLTMVSRGNTSGGSNVEDPTPGEHAGVLGVARVSDNGEHVYFVARGVLTKAANSNGEVAQAGGYNLYDYDSATGLTSFAAVLMSSEEGTLVEEAVALQAELEVLEQQGTCESLEGPESSEEELELCDAELEAMRLALPAKIAAAVAAQVSVDIGLEPSNERMFETTADGRYLIFESARGLTGSEDTSTVRQLFEYDATTGILRRASIGQGGYNHNGNTENVEYVPRIVVPNDAHGGEPTAAWSSLSVAETGYVFFTSRDRLTATAIEGHENIYEYRPPATGSCGAEMAGGCLDLISPGDEATPAEVRSKPRLLGADPSGGDVFFVSGDSLVPRDTDTQLDWYDARVEGGFEEAIAGPGCSEETCQGQAIIAPILPSLGGSATQSGEPPVALAPGARASAPKMSRLARALKACRKGPRKQRRACEARARRRYSRRRTVITSGRGVMR